MGSSVLTAKMPEVLRLIFIRAFAQLPYHVLWKWEADETALLIFQQMCAWGAGCHSRISWVSDHLELPMTIMKLGTFSSHCLLSSYKATSLMTTGK